MSTNGSYHINHSSKVVHLKWGVKRSLILPRSSCFKTKTCKCVGTGWWPETGGHPWLRGRFLVGWTLGLQEPRTQISSPLQPIRPLQDPAMSTGFPPKDGYILKPHPNLESRSWEADPLGLGLLTPLR